MIQYAVQCSSGHRFDGWFKSARAFEDQAKQGAIDCPVCGDRHIEKALMAPAVSRSHETLPVAAGHPEQARIRALLKALRRKVEAEADYVGDRFAAEARKIHYGEVDERGIYGEASREDVEALLDDGIDVMPLPVLPDDRN